MTKVGREKYFKQRIIGLVPAAGEATRLAPLPFSKELYPIGHMRFRGGNNFSPKPVCMYLLEKMKIAGVKNVFIVLRKGKWDIPGYLGDGSTLDMNFAYLMMNLPFGVPYTLSQAYPFAKDAIIVFGFPDIIFQPDDAFIRLLAKQSDTNADVVLGIFPTESPHKWDVIDFDKKGRVRGIIIKPHHADLRYAWAIAVWTPVFTRFMHSYLFSHQKLNNEDHAGNKSSEHQELCVGDIIHSAIQNNLHVESVIFEYGSCLDVGTPEDMVTAIKSQI